MAESDTRVIVHELYDAYGRRDFERVAALIHDEIDWVIYAPMSVFPFAGPRRGRAALMSDVGYRQRSTNRVLRLRVANFLRFEDGRLIVFREFIDSFDAVEQALGRVLQL